MDTKRNRNGLFLALMVLLLIATIAFRLFMYDDGNRDLIVKEGTIVADYQLEQISLEEYFEEFGYNNEFRYDLESSNTESFSYKNPRIGFTVSNDKKLTVTTGDGNPQVLTENFSELFFVPGGNEVYYLELLAEDGFTEEGQQMIEFTLNAYKITVAK